MRKRKGNSDTAFAGFCVGSCSFLQNVYNINRFGLLTKQFAGRSSIMGVLLLGGFLMVVIIPVVIAVVSSVVSGIAAAVDDEED